MVVLTGKKLRPDEILVLQGFLWLVIRARISGMHTRARPPRTNLFQTAEQIWGSGDKPGEGYIFKLSF